MKSADHTWLGHSGVTSGKGSLVGMRFFVRRRRFNLTPETVIESYAERWSIESMFHQLKQSWGLKDAWQQQRQTLHLWVHLTQVGYGLIQPLGYLDDEVIRQLCQHSPWRRHHPSTAG